MISDIDVWRAAQLLVRQHQDGAAQAAGRRASELGQAGDAEGQAVWLRIAAATLELQRQPTEGETLN